MGFISCEIVYFLGSMGVWGDSRVEFELMLTPELWQGVRDCITKRGVRTHWRLDRIFFKDIIFVDILYSLDGLRGVDGYYVHMANSTLYSGSRRVRGLTEEQGDMRDLLHDLYWYGVTRGAHGHDWVDVCNYGVNPCPFLWLPVMVILVRLGVFRGLRDKGMSLRMVHWHGNTIYFGALLRLSGSRWECHFVGDERSGYKSLNGGSEYSSLAEGLLGYGMTDLYNDIYGFLLDFAWS